MIYNKKFFLKEREGQTHLKSSEIQAPFLVVLTKRCFFTSSIVITSTNLLVQDRLVSTMADPKADKLIILLLAAYFSLDLEYPTGYMQFMRAIERLVTGKIAPSKYGNTKAALVRFLSQIGIKF